MLVSKGYTHPRKITLCCDGRMSNDKMHHYGLVAYKYEDLVEISQNIRHSLLHSWHGGRVRKRKKREFQFAITNVSAITIKNRLPLPGRVQYSSHHSLVVVPAFWSRGTVQGGSRTCNLWVCGPAVWRSNQLSHQYKPSDREAGGAQNL